MFAPWPKPLGDDFKLFYGLAESDEKFIESRNELIVQGRDLRRQANIPANKKVKFVYKPVGQPHDGEVLKLLLNAEAIEVSPNFQPAKNVLAVRHESGELFLPLEGLVDAGAEKARQQKVPANVLEEHQKRLADWRAKREHVKAALAALGA
jgi:valyl-tRNA synthetase